MAARRPVVAVIGNGGAISEALAKTAQELGQKVIDAGFRWTPDVSQVGTHNVVFKVESLDPVSSVETAQSITVYPSGAPVITSVPHSAAAIPPLRSSLLRQEPHW